MISLEEKTALLRAKNPRSANQYRTFERDEQKQKYIAWKVVFDDGDADMEFIEFTRDQRAVHCWFTDYNHMIMINDLYRKSKKETSLQTN